MLVAFSYVFPIKTILSKFDIKKQNIFFIEILILYLEVRVLVQVNSYVQVEIGKFYCVDLAKVCFDITKVFGLVLHIAYVIRVYQTEPRQPGV